MSYIGTPPSNAFTSLLKQDFSTSATTSYTLDHAVNNANDIALFINFVRQEPTAAYAASGTSLTLTSATASSDDMYCVYLGQALQTVNPSNASVGTAQLADSSVTSAKLASGAVANTPAFQAVMSSTQTFSDNTFTKASLATEVFDTNSNYDTSNYRFTPTVAGKYYVHFQWGEGGSSPQALFANIYKNGSNVSEGRIYMTAAADKLDDFITMTSKIIEMNGSSDYLEFYVKQLGGNKEILANTFITFAEAYKIIE